MLPFHPDTRIVWSSVKSQRLKRTRGVSFEEVLRGVLIDIIDHPNKEDQRLLLIDYREYIFVVPFAEKENEIFLKTLYPCRKYTRIYREGGLL